MDGRDRSLAKAAFSELRVGIARGDHRHDTKEVTMENTESLGGSQQYGSDRIRVPEDTLTDKLRDSNDRALQFIRERPATCLLGAIAVGYVIGRIVRARG